MNEPDLNELLASADLTPLHAPHIAREAPSVAGPRDGESNIDYAQWQLGSNGRFFPCGRTATSLPPGNYWPRFDPSIGPYLELRSVTCDEIVELPDSASLRVLATMRRFWDSRSRYEQHGLLYKRGILLWGPPGSGKSVTVRLLGREIMARGGVVIHFSDNDELLERLVHSARDIEPERNIIVVLEDIDEILTRHGEHKILGMLDGELQVSNIVYLATTNYPERLGPRIVNRPSRFDERIFIGMPTPEARRHYLLHATEESPDVGVWVDDTDGLSIAHLRELVAAVYCLGEPYEDTLARLRSMMERPRDVEGFSQRAIGMVR